MPAFDQYYPFDQGPGATATQTNWINLGSSFRDAGILRSVANNLRPTLASPGSVNIDTGAAFIRGIYVGSTGVKNFAVPTGAGTGGIIVAQADFINRVGNLVFNSGVYAPVQTATLWEITVALTFSGVLYDCRTFTAPTDPIGIQTFSS